MNKEIDNKTPPLAGRLYQLMEKSGVNKSGLARICGVTPQSAGKWFKSGSISKDSAMKIADAFGVSLSWLLGDDPEMDSLPDDFNFTPEMLDDKQRLLLKLFSRLPESEKDTVINMLTGMVDNYDKLFKELIKSRNIEEIMKVKKGD